MNRLVRRVRRNADQYIPKNTTPNYDLESESYVIRRAPKNKNRLGSATLAQRVNSLENEVADINTALAEHVDELNNHEKRITNIETTIMPGPASLPGIPPGPLPPVGGPIPYNSGYYNYGGYNCDPYMYPFPVDPNIGPGCGPVPGYGGPGCGPVPGYGGPGCGPIPGYGGPGCGPIPGYGGPGCGEPGLGYGGPGCGGPGYGGPRYNEPNYFSETKKCCKKKNKKKKIKIECANKSCNDDCSDTCESTDSCSSSSETCSDTSSCSSSSCSSSSCSCSSCCSSDSSDSSTSCKKKKKCKKNISNQCTLQDLVQLIKNNCDNEKIETCCSKKPCCEPKICCEPKTCCEPKICCEPKQSNNCCESKKKHCCSSEKMDEVIECNSSQSVSDNCQCTESESVVDQAPENNIMDEAPDYVDIDYWYNLPQNSKNIHLIGSDNDSIIESMDKSVECSEKNMSESSECKCESMVKEKIDDKCNEKSSDSGCQKKCKTESNESTTESHRTNYTSESKSEKKKIKIKESPYEMICEPMADISKSSEIILINQPCDIVCKNAAMIWAKKISKKDNIISTNIAIDSEFNVIQVGYYIPMQSDIECDCLEAYAYINKYNSSGTKIWGAKIIGIMDDRSLSVITDTQDSIILVAPYKNKTVKIYDSNDNLVTSILTNPTTNSFIIKYDACGNVAWATTLISQCNASISAIATDMLDNIFVIGQFNEQIEMINATGGCGLNLTNISENIFLGKYNNEGCIQWGTYLPKNDTNAIPINIDAMIDGSVIVGGTFGNGTLNIYNANNIIEPSGITLVNDKSLAGFIIRYSGLGIAEWATMIGDISCSANIAISTDNDCNIIVAGQTQSSQLCIYNAPNANNQSNLPFCCGGNDIFITKFSSNGQSIWATKISGPNLIDRVSLAVDSANNIIVSGLFNGGPIDLFNSNNLINSCCTIIGSDCCTSFIVKYNYMGQIMWLTKQENVLNNCAIFIKTDCLNNILATGLYNEELSIYNSDGCVGKVFKNNGYNTAFIVKYIDFSQILNLSSGCKYKTLILNDYRGYNTLIHCNECNLCDEENDIISDIVLCDQGSSVKLEWSDNQWVIKYHKDAQFIRCSKK